MFFAADRQFVDRLAAAGVLIPETRSLYAQGRLVLVTASGSGPRLTDLRDLLAVRVRHVAIANPAHAPYGLAAEEALHAALSNLAAAIEEIGVFVREHVPREATESPT